MPAETALTSADAQIPAAVQVVRAFFDGLNYEIDNKGDESRAARTFNTECSNCVATVSKIHDLFVGGHSLRGGHYHLKSVDRSYPTDQTHVAIEITDYAGPGQQVDSSGHVTREFSGAKPTRLVFYVTVNPGPPMIGAFFLHQPS